MPKLKDYHEFEGRHWETGAVRNALAYQGVVAPHSGQAPTEALLLGISGGAAFGYFVFDYQSSDPFVALLSRNTFDPLDTLLERLGIAQDRLHTPDPAKAERNLIAVLEGGRPAILWADVFGLPYNALEHDERMWTMNPIVVFGFDDGYAHIADRAAVPLKVSAEQLARARGRIKKDKHRVLALEPPNWERLPAAVEHGLRDCIALYTEAPPKGARHSFGFAGYDRLAEMLTNTRNKQSWARQLAPGRRMYAALAGFGFQPGAFGWARTFASNQVDDKAMYADFLGEAATILDRPGLLQAADHFRLASAAWRELSDRMLPDEVPLFGETRRLLLERREQFVREGDAALPDLQKINRRLEKVFAAVTEDFPLSDSEAAQLRAELASQVRSVAELERQAIGQMQAALA